MRSTPATTSVDVPPARGGGEGKDAPSDRYSASGYSGSHPHSTRGTSSGSGPESSIAVRSSPRITRSCMHITAVGVPGANGASSTHG